MAVIPASGIFRANQSAVLFIASLRSSTSITGCAAGAHRRKDHAAFGELRTEWGGEIHGWPAKARADRGCALQCPPTSSAAELDWPFAVSMRHCHLVTLGHWGPVRSTGSSAPLKAMRSGWPPFDRAPRMYARKRPSGKFQSASDISAPVGVSHFTSKEPSGFLPPTQRCGLI